jgi:hypothetical protein
VHHGGEEGLPGVMHVESDLRDDICVVGTGEYQVLEGNSGTFKLSQINSGRSRLSRDLGLCVYRCQNWLAVHHVGALNDVNSIEGWDKETRGERGE